MLLCTREERDEVFKCEVLYYLRAEERIEFQRVRNKKISSVLTMNLEISRTGDANHALINIDSDAGYSGIA
jgi:hypothetical protein